jgi:hypothetical protein
MTGPTMLSMRRIIASIAFVLSASIAAAQTPQYDVYAIRYATIPGFPVASLIAGLEKGADESRKIDIAMMVWLVRGGGRNIVVDSGFYRPQFFKSFKVTDFVRPDEAVARAGVKPEEVTDVILTHAHWDHADGADLFPMYLSENLEKHVPIAQTFDAASNLAAQDRMKTLVKDPRFIIPGHDSAVLTRFPKVVDAVVRIE